MSFEITDVRAREILDSRGNPTVEVDVILDGEFIGRAGPWQPEGWPDFEIGWTLRLESWGKGYATEAVRACIKHAFTALDRDHIISVIDPDNVRSIRVAERVGESLQGTTTLPNVANTRSKELLQYGMSRAQWAGLK